jgi:CheY-like chemotaxis protein
MPSSKVLVVEDEFLIRLTIVEALSDEGFEVLEAGTGQDALQALRSNPDLALLLTDIQLPGGINGRDLVRMARETKPDLPVIFMSGRPDTSGAGPSSRELYLTKPYLPSELCAAARRLIGD